MYPEQSFNSLQTGKCIQSLGLLISGVACIIVSIPFKRESVFRGETALLYNGNEQDMFQFPSNGKVYSEQEQLWESADLIDEFQFPSNGKVYSELIEVAEGIAQEGVSIPFKRESVFRAMWVRIPPSVLSYKVSIPFKRESVFRGVERC